MNLCNGSHIVFIGAGSNVGDRLQNLQHALEMLDELPLTFVEGVSGIYISEPLGYTDQDWFYNAAFRLCTGLTPERLLSYCKRIEVLIGRPADHPRWGPRVIDLDILLHGDTVCNLGHLTIPHPELHNRKFALLPLRDLADPVHPVLGKKMHELLESCSDRSIIERSDHTFIKIR